MIQRFVLKRFFHFCFIFNLKIHFWFRSKRNLHKVIRRSVMKLADDHYLSDDEEVHIKYITSLNASTQGAWCLDGISLRVLVEFFVIQIKIFSLWAVNVVKPVTYSVVLLGKFMKTVFHLHKCENYLVENCSVWA